MGLSRLFPEIRLASLIQTLVLAALAAGCTFKSPSASGIDAPPIPGDDAMGIPVDAPRPWLAPWTHRKRITLLASKIEAPGDGVLTDFPVLISVIDSDLASTALTTGQDIVFTTVDATTILASEIESFKKANGELIAWVKIPSLSATTDTQLYVYYGNQKAPMQQPKNVWTADYLAVWHLQQIPGTGTSDILDSTRHGRNGTAIHMDANNSAMAQIGSGIRFDGSQEYLHFTKMNFGMQFTISMWVDSPGQSNAAMLLANSDTGINRNGFRLSINSFNTTDRRILFNVGNGTAGQVAQTNIAAIQDNAPTHIAVVVNRTISTTSTADIYVNGTNVTVDTSILGIFETDNDFDIGRAENNIYHFPGVLDEVRVAGTLRSREWLLTSYRNQSQPETFHTFGPQESTP